MKTNMMTAYHGNPQIKANYLQRVQEHRKADELVQGYGYWQDGKGCAVGCTIHSGDHKAYETELGIPRRIAYLEDRLFEALPQKNAREWPEKFLAAIPVGADLSGVVDQFLHWLLVDPLDGVIRFAKTDRTKKAVQDVADLYAKKIAGETVTREQWELVRKAAAADAAAADAAAYAAAAAAAYAAAAAAAAYADAAADADADADARTKARVRQSEKLLELLAAAPVIEVMPA